MLSFALFVFFILPSNANAQVTCGTGWTVYNNTSCSIRINYFYICNGTNCSTGNISVSVPASGGSINVPACGTCSACDFLVRIVNINGTPYCCAGVDSGQTSTLVSVAPAGCFSASGNMTWNPTTFQVNINP